MIIVVNMKNVSLRGKTYSFRRRVPKDCIEAMGRSVISQSLGTKNRLEAEKKAAFLDEKWEAEFKKIRNSSLAIEDTRPSLSDPIDETVDYYQEFRNAADKHLSALFDTSTEEELLSYGEFFGSCLAIIQNKPETQFELSQLELSWPLPSAGSPGKNRKRKRALIKVIGELCQVVYKEVGESLPDEVKALIEGASDNLKVVPATTPSSKISLEKGANPQCNIFKISEQWLASKTRSVKTVKKVKTEVAIFVEWLNGRVDITTYTKDDLIDYIQNCLPHIPKNRNQGAAYKGKPIHQCVKMTQRDPEQHVPISYITCKNRLVALGSIFTFAKDYLGIIQVNPSKGIEVPKVRVIEDRPKAYTPTELEDFWNALSAVKADLENTPSHYWVPILSLYHGFRSNEACGLFLKDVYEDDDGVFVIDINADGENKSIKTKSSKRRVPIHPFVINNLRFPEFVESQKQKFNNGILFQDVFYSEENGYQTGMSKWFARWKKTWLSKESAYKDFHGLRHTFIQQAQNQAKMSDRCCQEITGHAVEGVSAVHLGYSGGLTPKTMLEELKELQYNRRF